jgi:DNA-binding helix-hairpin-helix protein with protein kinase domain
MNQLLNRGQTVNTLTKMPSTVEQFLGGGGQGEVYRANLGGKPLALKWYFATQATAEQQAALEHLIRIGPPNSNFLWPLELTIAPGVAGFGYLMPLREERYRSINDLMKRRIDPPFRVLATAGLELAHSFLQLHTKGMCYRDISFGNVFFAPDTGEVLICDNDNVAFDGAPRGAVLGTPRFMAPEIVRGEAPPSTQSDLFSLAVLLFYLFVVHHPLEGRNEAAIRCFDLPAMTKIYGTEPLFIFDPQDDSNRPVPGYQDNALAFWPIYPTFLRKVFERAFTEGLRDPQHGRVRESEWRQAMVRLRDVIFYCGHCGSENFYDVETLRLGAGKPGPCWQCRKELRLPFRMRVGKNVLLMLNHDTQVFPHHVDEARKYDFSRPVATVTRHPQRPDIWGLTNCSSDKWVSTTATGQVTDVEPKRSVNLAVGTHINFGSCEGEIRL